MNFSLTVRKYVDINLDDLAAELYRIDCRIRQVTPEPYLVPKSSTYLFWREEAKTIVMDRFRLELGINTTA